MLRRRTVQSHSDRIERRSLFWCIPRLLGSSSLRRRWRTWDWIASYSDKRFWDGKLWKLGKSAWKWLLYRSRSSSRSIPKRRLFWRLGHNRTGKFNDIFVSFLHHHWIKGILIRKQISRNKANLERLQWNHSDWSHYHRKCSCLRLSRHNDRCHLSSHNVRPKQRQLGKHQNMQGGYLLRQSISPCFAKSWQPHPRINCFIYFNQLREWWKPILVQPAYYSTQRTEMRHKQYHLGHLRLRWNFTRCPWFLTLHSRLSK